MTSRLCEDLAVLSASVADSLRIPDHDSEVLSAFHNDDKRLFDLIQKRGETCETYLRQAFSVSSLRFARALLLDKKDLEALKQLDLVLLMSGDDRKFGVSSIAQR